MSEIDRRLDAIRNRSTRHPGLYADDDATIAMDGCAMLRADGEYGDRAPCPWDIAATARDWRARAKWRPANRIQWPTLAGAMCCENERHDCPKCAGKGRIWHTCNCEFCDVSTAAPCVECDGCGWLVCNHTWGGTRIKIGRYTFGAELIAATIPETPTHYAQIPKGPLVMRGDGWFAAVMRRAK